MEQLPVEQPELEMMTRVLVKGHDAAPLPKDESVYYLVARNGLFLCRNHEFFQSCVPARSGPGELGSQDVILRARFPKLPQGDFERIVGFFSRAAEVHGSEAGAHLAWDRDAERVRILVPKQTATMQKGWNGSTWPIGLHYDVPAMLPPRLMLFGDIHSHVDMAAYSSATDVHDEMHRPGLHIVVGRIHQEPPQFHVEAVVDGHRFKLDINEAIEGYERRDDDFPKRWMEKLSVTTNTSYAYAWNSGKRGNGRKHWDEPSSGRYQ